MVSENRDLVSAWPRTPLARYPLYLGAVVMAVACGNTSSGSGSGGSSGLGGMANAGGVAPIGGTGAGGPGMGGTIANGGLGAGGSATGGATSGGAPAGGSSAGGAPAGGASSGGSSAGGSSAGGSATGGASSGGAPAGGSSAGGAPAGGSSAGGAPAGGASAGGASAGGDTGAIKSTGCSKTSTLTFGTVPGESGSSVGTGDGGYVQIQSSGETRGFAMRLPDNYDNTHPYWLIFGFHWNGGNSKEVDTGGSNGYISAHFGLQMLSNNGAIFVAPDGINAGWQNSGGRDLQFVDDMVQLIEENYCVDTSHLFANGFSYGGGMTYELACARANVFRGAAIYEGAQLSGCDGGNDPIALWQMVGLEDTICGMNLATPIRDRFVENNGCTPQNPPQPPQAPPYLSPGGHICTDYQGCSAGHPLRWCVHQSGHGNAIVDGTGDLYNTCATPPNSCSDSCPCSWVPEDVWSFFQSLDN